MVLPNAAGFSDSLISAFTEYLSRHPQHSISENSIKEEEPFIRLRLQYYLVMAYQEAVAANRVLIETDPQVAAGIEALPRAAQLARLAARIRNTK